MHSRGIAVRPAMGVGGQCPFSCPCTFCFYMLPRPKVRSYAHPPFPPISCASHSLPPSLNLLMSSIDDCRAKPIFKVFCVQLSSTIMKLVISVWSGKRTNVGWLLFTPWNFCHMYICVDVLCNLCSTLMHVSMKIWKREANTECCAKRSHCKKINLHLWLLLHKGFHIAQSVLSNTNFSRQQCSFCLTTIN